MERLFRQFSFPGGIGSHVTPETPGSIHEGGELGYALVHAFGAAFDNPDLVVFCVVGDGEAETGPLAASWHSNKFLDPATDGTVVPILALNGYKIANPTILDRIPEDELIRLFEGYGYAPRIVAGDDPMAVHAAMAETMDALMDELAAIKARRPVRGGRPAGVADDHPADAEGLDRAQGRRRQARPRGPGAPTRCRCRTSGPIPSTSPSSRRGCGPTDPTSCSTQAGRPRDDILDCAPRGDRRMSANPHANGGLLLRDLQLPDFRDYARRGRRRRATCDERGDARPRDLAPRRHPRQSVDLPALRPGRDGLEPARRRVRGDRSRLDGARSGRRDEHLAPSVASSRSCPSTSARAGWRATC